MATGTPNLASMVTEVIDLSDNPVTCKGLGDFPLKLSCGSGGLLNGSLPIVCGGKYVNLDKDCFILGTNEKIASLKGPRANSAAVTMFDKLWITGGYDDYNYLNSTEILDVTVSPASVVQGPELPMPMSSHCIAKLNDSTVFFMAERKTFFYDLSANVWTSGPDMAHERYGFGCGNIKGDA